MAFLAAIPELLMAALPEAGAAAATSLGAEAIGVASLAAPAAAGAGIGSTLSTIGTIAGLAGSGLQAVGTMNQAKYGSEVAQVQNQELNQKANQDAASAERQQITAERQTELALSRTQALAAASGGGATDPTVLNVEGQIARQGTYNALSALYNGTAAAAADRYQGKIDLFQAGQQAAAAPFAALGQVLSGISSLANNRAMMKYYANPAVG